MTILPFLILASLVMAGGALVGFIWAVATGQFEDTCTPSMRILMEEFETSRSLKEELVKKKNEQTEEQS